MVLLEDAHNRVLYTGDFRLDGDAVRAHPILSTISLDRLYIDTTFCTPRAAHFPSRVCFGWVVGGGGGEGSFDVLSCMCFPVCAFLYVLIPMCIGGID